MACNTQKSAKLGVYLLWGSYDHENDPSWPSGPIGSKAKILMDVHARLTLNMGHFGHQSQLAPYLRS
ncbi:hypothetical protein H5410_031947 [Solanum commersonii]|uniref:Uncharacterized protein n=1 Tax=Solanum commersonii TaxID=4109 RepID=A0A9J5YJS4_SOLCO|nr:hypothetical protein H5410_031947 [Solanum commersonii]